MAEKLDIKFISYDEFVRNKSKIATLMEDRACCYLGNGYFKFLQIKSHLSDAQVQNLGEALNEIFHKTSEQIRNIDHIVESETFDDLNVVSSSLFERTPYSSSLHVDIARSLYLLGYKGKPLLAICENVAQAQMFRALLTENGRHDHVLLDGVCHRITDRCRDVFANIRNLVSGGRHCIKRINYVRQKRKETPLDVERLKANDVLMMLWADSSTFGDDIMDDATYYGEIPKYLREDDRKVCYVVSTLYWSDDYKKVIDSAMNSKDALFFIEDCWNISDIFAHYFKSVLNKGKFGQFNIGEYNLSSIFRYIKNRDNLSFFPVQSSLYEKIGYFLKRNKIKPEKIFHICENHAWEKCSKIGFRKYLPEAKIYSCVQSPVLESYSNFFFSDKEIQTKQVPDRLLVCGSRFVELYKNIGFPEDRIYNIGATRHKAFLETNKAKDLRTFHENSISILCATNSSVEDCCELILKTLKASHDLPSVTVMANFHPLSDSNFVQAIKKEVERFKPENSEVTYVMKGVRDVLEDVDLLFYSDTNAAFEAIARGVVTVHVGRENALDYDTVGSEGSLYLRSTQQIREFLSGGKELVGANRVSQLDRLNMLESAFGPVNKNELYRALLEK